MSALLLAMQRAPTGKLVGTNAPHSPRDARASVEMRRYEMPLAASYGETAPIRRSVGAFTARTGATTTELP
jgi:hypothetical protein